MFTLPISALFAQTSSSAARSSKLPSIAAPVRGVVFDSLLRKPVNGAVIWVSGTALSTVADANGRFNFDSVPTGKHFLAFSSPSLDSISIGTLGSVVDVRANEVMETRLATPSFATLRRAMCGNTAKAGVDEGIVWGTVRDAATNTRLSGAPILFSWYELSVIAEKKVQFGESTRTAITDSTGTYYRCELPADLRISSRAEGTRSSSGTVEYSIGKRRIFRVDLLVSTDMEFPSVELARTAAESLSASHPHGSATLRGIVRDEKNRPLSEAMIVMASVDTSVRTNSAGEFVLRDMPAGSHMLLTRQLGFAPATEMIDLHPKTTTDVIVQLKGSATLATFNVRAKGTAGQDRLGFTERKEAGFGRFLEQKDLAGKWDLTGLLREFLNVQVTSSRSGNGFSNGHQGQDCPNFYYDGIHSDYESVSMHKVEDFRGIEMFPRRLAPLEYRGFAECPVVLIWSRYSKW